jgi:hypothetical protein
MRAIVPVQQGVSGGSRSPATSVRAIENASASSALGREKHDGDDEKENRAPPLRVEHVSRDETPRFDPFWDGPRLVPAFVAQLLAQTVPDRRQSVAVETAYGRAVSPRMALLLDRKS